jgi:mannose-6-phosphate isomerase
MQKIFNFEPIYKEKIWGGRNIEIYKNHPIPKGNIGESWELSVFGNDHSIISDGFYAGQTFQSVYEKHGKELFKIKDPKTNPFPLLVKIIDAKEKLSVQVHPDDTYAEKYDPESNGKQESWIILDHSLEAKISLGFKTDTNREEFEKLISNNQAEKVLNEFLVKRGDAFLLKPGTIHAIGAGNLILEVQESSDSTYRVYDYGRTGEDGKPRPLHLKKALDVLNYKKGNSNHKLKSEKKKNPAFEQLILTSNDKFTIEQWNLKDEQMIPEFEPNCGYKIFHVAEGKIFFPEANLQLVKGQTGLLSHLAFMEMMEAATNTRVFVSWAPIR